MPSEEEKIPRVEKMFTSKGTTLLTSAMTAGISREELVERRDTQDSYCEHFSYVGAGLGDVLFAFAIPLLCTIIGKDAIDVHIFYTAQVGENMTLGMPASFK
jgi:hypothetical protein